MTNQEAIHILQNSRLVSENFTEEGLTAAYIMAIGALEKQEPKKPGTNTLGQPCCPSCGLNVYKDEWGGRYTPCCDNCGQAIDWKDILKERGLMKEGGEGCLSQD